MRQEKTENRYKNMSEIRKNDERSRPVEPFCAEQSFTGGRRMTGGQTKTNFVTLVNKGCAQKIETACRISGRGADRRRRRFLVFCVAVERNIQPCFSRVASLCLVSRDCTVPPCIISFRAASSRPVLFSVSPCFFQAFVSCLPRLFSTYALLFPQGSVSRRFISFRIA